MILPHSTTIKTTFTALTLVLGATACEQYPLHDLGYTNGNPPGSNGGPGAPLPPVAEFTSQFDGIWIGEADDPLALQSNADDSPPSYRFPSGSRRIRLELAPNYEDPDLSFATITFGAGTPPPPATDPNVGYPPDPNFDITARSSDDGSVRPPVEGFAYSLGVGGVGAARELDLVGSTGLEVQQFLDERRVADGALHLSYTTMELFGSWCALQTPESCRENQGYFTDDDGACFQGSDTSPTDCQKLVQCELGTCYCDEGAPCSYSPYRQSTLLIRFSAENELVGLFDGAVFVNERGFQQPLGTVHFRREE